MKRYTDNEYRRMAKVVRRYTVGFDTAGGYDLRKVGAWSGSRKAAVTRYFNLINSFSHKPAYVYRPRSKKNLEAVKKALGVSDYPRLVAPLIQVAHGGAKPKVSISKAGAVKIETPTVSRELLLFSDYGITPEYFATDPHGAITDFVDSLEKDYTYFSVMAGEFEVGHWEQKSKGIPKFMKGPALINEVMKLVNAYAADKFDPDNPSSSYYGNWLRGAVGYRFPTHAKFRDYLKTMNDYKRESEKIKEKIRRAKSQIERWKKEYKTLTRKRRIDPVYKRRRLRTIENSIDKKRDAIRSLILSRIKRSQRA